MTVKGFFVPSDSLALLREFIAGMPLLAPIFEIFPQLRLIIDSNAIISDLIWLTKKRKDLSARTSLQEVIASGTIVAFAPFKLREEVEEHLPDIATTEDIPIELLRKEWKNYQRYLRFCETSQLLVEPQVLVADPEDQAFVYLYSQVGAAAVVSRDRHISKMGAPTVPLDVIIYLKKYARAKSVELTIILGSSAVTLITIESVSSFIKLVSALFSRLPLWAQLGLIIGTGILSVHPNSRLAIKRFIKYISHELMIRFTEFKPIMIQLVQSFETASVNAEEALVHINKALPPNKRVPLRIVAYSVCLAAKRPLTLSQIEKKILMNGYKTQSKHFRHYLQRVLTKDQRFSQTENGSWVVMTM